MKENNKSLSDSQLIALDRLLLSYQLINQAVGDAISDFLFVEAILSIYDWKLEDWASLYTDLPSKQSKVIYKQINDIYLYFLFIYTFYLFIIILQIKVKDRNVVVTIPDESRVISPIGLQESIDEIITSNGIECGRAFVRPSGTEDAVRIYAEGDNN